MCTQCENFGPEYEKQMCLVANAIFLSSCTIFNLLWNENNCLKLYSYSSELFSKLTFVFYCFVVHKQNEFVLNKYFLEKLRVRVKHIIFCPPKCHMAENAVNKRSTRPKFLWTFFPTISNGLRWWRNKKKAKDLNRNEILDVCRFISCFGLFEGNFALKMKKFIWKVRTIWQDQTILFIQRWDKQNRTLKYYNIVLA